MAIQIKIIKQLCKPESNIPFKEDVYIIDDSNADETIFKFAETDNVYLSFCYDNNECLVEYEDFDSGEMTEAPSNERIHFSSGNDDTGAYVAGFFTIKVTSNNKIRNYLFLVEPKNLEYQNVLNLRTYVNSFYNGLSLDLQKKRKVGDTASEEINSNIFVNYTYLSDNFSSIMNHINNYINAKYEEPIKLKSLTRKPKKFGPESAKWLAKKGLSYNNDSDELSTVLVNKTHFTINNTQNRIFKSELLFWDGELKSIMDAITDYYHSLEEKLNLFKQDIINAEEHYNIVQTQRTISERIKKEEFNNIKHKKDELSNLESIVDDYRNRIRNINHFRTSLENAEYNTWVKNVNIENVSFSYATNKRLIMLRELKDNYLGLKRRAGSGNGIKRINYFSEKSTPKLFETYCYVLLIRLLKSKGFEFSDDLFTKDLMFVLSNSSVITMHNENLYCDIIYDTEVRRSNAEFLENGYCTINSHHNKPDFILSFYEEKGKPLHTIITEVKWRSLKNIYNEIEDTDVVANLKDYYNFGYRDIKTNRTNRAVVSKVIVIYPDSKENYTEIQDDDIVAVGLSINSEIERTIGYNRITDIIDNVTNE